MDKLDRVLDLGMLCRGCNCSSTDLPDLQGFSESEVRSILTLCKLCVESHQAYRGVA